MKLGDIKIEALKLMFAGYGDDMTEENLDRYLADENYKNYLVNMPGAINRCFALLENKKVLPVRSVTVEKGEMGEKFGRMHVDLALLAPDLHALFRVVTESEACYESSESYALEGSMLIAPMPEEEAEMRVLYYPKMERVSAVSADGGEIDLPEDLACLIPYYIKSDLFREDEPEEAEKARVLFESALAEYKRNEPVELMQERVVHKMGEWWN